VHCHEECNEKQRTLKTSKGLMKLVSGYDREILANGRREPAEVFGTWTHHIHVVSEEET